MYETTDNINDAFISYRNIIEMYLARTMEYITVSRYPINWKKTSSRMASLIGFIDEQKRYEKQFKTSVKNISAKHHELLLFW